MRKSDSLDDYTFREEVPDDNLYDKSNIDDLIYVKDRKFRRKMNFLIFLAIFFVVSSLILCLFGLAYTNKKVVVEENIIEYDLLVSHTNNYYGRSAISFKDYSSLEKALDYSFKIQNNNDVVLDYKLVLNNPYFGQDGIDMSLINYKVMIDNNEVFSGNLENAKDVELGKTSISAYSIHDVTFKIWSSKIEGNNKFNFKIDVVS